MIGIATVVACLLAGKPAPLRAEDARNLLSAFIKTQVTGQLARIDHIPKAAGETVFEKAVRVRIAIKQGDFETARRISNAVLTESRLRNWDFYPFSDFMNAVSDIYDRDFADQLTKWVQTYKNDQFASLLRAQYHFDGGWAKRGHGYSKNIESERMAYFQHAMENAVADVDNAISLNDKNPYAFYLKLRILHGYGLTVAMSNAFDQAVRAFPSYYPIYDIMLWTLDPRWGGTVDRMYRFVEGYAGGADERSPLKTLYLTLYRDLLDAASHKCQDSAKDFPSPQDCVKEHMGRLLRPTLEEEISSAIRTSQKSDKYESGIFLEDLISNMLYSRGSDLFSGSFLQMTAGILESETQLSPIGSQINNYVIDSSISTSWFLKRHYDNALRKDRQALDNLRNTKFPSGEEEDLARARIYDHMAKIYGRTHEYIQTIVYEKAAIALSGRVGGQHVICYAYFQLKDYADALEICDTIIKNDPNNVETRYWRALVFKEMGKTDEQLADLTFVADSEHSFRRTAAIGSSMIFFGRGDLRGALNVLNSHPYLYNPALSSKDDIAVAYNNRCYAYMELGELEKALDDCTASLRYGSIPDALRKEQELIKRLGASRTHL